MKRLLSLLLAVLLLATMLPVFAVAETTTVTINVMLENRSDSEQEGFKVCVVDPFLAEHPEVKINWLPTPDTMNVIRTQMAAGQGADLCFLDGPTAATELAKAGRIMDLGKYYEKYGWEKIFKPWALNSVKYEDKYIAIPAEVDSMWMFYNTDLFSELGITVPTNYEEYCKACEQSIAAGYTACAFGNAGSQSDADHWLSMAYNMYAGSEAIRAGLKNEARWDEGLLKGAIECLNEVWQKGYINDCQSYAVAKNDARTLFYTGRATMKLDGNWYYAKLLHYGEVNYDIAMLPTWRDDNVSSLPLGLGEALVINVNASEAVADVCAELINFALTRTDLHIKQMVEYGINPLPIDIPVDQIPEDANPVFKKMIAYMNDATANLESAGMVLWTFWPAEMRTWQYQNIDNVFMGTMTVDEFCQGSQEIFDKCYAEGSVPSLP